MHSGLMPGHRSSGGAFVLLLLLALSSSPGVVARGLPSPSAAGPKRTLFASSSSRRSLLQTQLPQQPILPGLELAHIDVQQYAAPEPSAQPKALSSFTAVPTPGTFSSIQARAANSSASKAATPAAAAPAASGDGAAAAPAPAAASPPPADTTAGSPQDPTGWQRRTMQLPPHVYLISFVMLLAIMAALLSCHCYRMCRIARRMRQAAELGITLSPAGATLNKRTPQSVIESLPVSKYAVVHGSKVAASRTASGAGGSAAAAGMVSRAVSAPAVGTGPGGVSSFLAAAMQIREQVSRQTGISTTTAAVAANSSSSNAAAAGSSSSSSGSNGAAAGSGSADQDREITPSPPLPAPAAAAVSPDGPSLLASAAAHKSASTAAAAAAAGGASSQVGAGHARGGSLPPSSSGGAEPCAICFDDFEADDDVKQLPCGHYFHPGCIDEWLVRDITCPLCKGMVLDESLMEQQEMLAVALQGSLLATSTLARTLRGRLSPQQQRQQQGEASAAAAAANRSRRRRLRRNQRAAAAAAAAASGTAAGASPATGGSSSSSAASSSSTAAAAAGAAGAPSRSRPRSGGSHADEMMDMLHMVMLGFPRMAPHLPSAAARQQQRQEEAQEQHQAARGTRSSSSGGGGSSSRFGRIFALRRPEPQQQAQPQQEQERRVGPDVEMGLAGNSSNRGGGGSSSTRT